MQINKKTVEIEFLVAKTQEERVNLARFVKNQLKNCFNQEGKKVEIKVNVVAEWNNFVNQLLLPYNYDMVFEPVSGSSMDTYFFNMLELSPKKWSFGVGFELDKKVLDLDFVELKKDLDASSNKPAWYKQFTQGLDRVVEKQKVKVLDGTGQPQKCSDGKEVYQEQKDANGETLKDENGNVMYVEKEVEIKPKVPGVNEQGKWQGTVSQFKTFFTKTLNDSANYSQYKQKKHYFVFLES